MLIDILCLGTPEVVGDSVGPRVGTLLQKTYKHMEEINIVGTLESPVTGETYEDKIQELRDEALTIVVDATIGEHVGTYEIKTEPTIPGAALPLPYPKAPIGEISVKAYTATHLVRMITARKEPTEDLADRIATGLIDLINTTLLKGIYIRNKIYHY